MDKVAIIGMAPSRSEAPYGDPKWEFWGLNNLYQHIPRYAKFDTWFEIHKFSIDPVTHKILRKGLSEWRGLLIDEYLRNLQSLNIPIYMQDKCQVVSNAIGYPLGDIIDEFGRYFTSTHSWMLALAISMKFKTIGIYGVDMSNPNYIGERPCFEYLLGMAKGRGIEVVIAESSPLLKCDKLYGFES